MEKDMIEHQLKLRLVLQKSKWKKMFIFALKDLLQLKDVGNSSGSFLKADENTEYMSETDVI